MFEVMKRLERFKEAITDDPFFRDKVHAISVFFAKDKEKVRP
jgi:hypothetical protein